LPPILQASMPDCCCWCKSDRPLSCVLITAVTKTAKALGAKLKIARGEREEGEGDEEEGDDEEGARLKDKLWGKKKRAYYDADNIDLEVRWARFVRAGCACLLCLCVQALRALCAGCMGLLALLAICAPSAVKAGSSFCTCMQAVVSCVACVGMQPALFWRLSRKGCGKCFPPGQLEGIGDLDVCLLEGIGGTGCQQC
jgi:hypothetical protein